jgi:hypothetical protein
MMSAFATIGKAKENDEDNPLAGMDEAKMERALAGLMREAEQVNEDDPRQMANLMRKFADATGLDLGEPMHEAIARMEAGEDPEQIEQEMGDLMDGEEPFSLEAMRKRRSLEAAGHPATTNGSTNCRARKKTDCGAVITPRFGAASFSPTGFSG